MYDVQIDGSFNVYYSTQEQELLCNQLLSRRYVEFTWISPLPREYARWLNVVFPFQALLWILVVASFIIVVLCFNGMATFG